MHGNLEHVLMNSCTDPDCEIHNIVVGCEELTLSEHDLAMWFAGAMYVIKNPGMHGVELGRALQAMSATQARIDTDILRDAELEGRSIETDLLEDR